MRTLPATVQERTCILAGSQFSPEPRCHPTLLVCASRGNPHQIDVMKLDIRAIATLSHMAR